MYDNIGEKIKGLAKAVFIIEAISTVILGIVIMANSYGMEEFVGLLVMIGGPFVAWVSSWLLYGFGQLIENSDIMTEDKKRKSEAHQKAVERNYERKIQKVAKEKIENPNISDSEYIDITCPNCKAELSYTKEQLQNKEALICPMCDTSFSPKL